MLDGRAATIDPRAGSRETWLARRGPWLDRRASCSLVALAPRVPPQDSSYDIHWLRPSAADKMSAVQWTGSRARCSPLNDRELPGSVP
jgi:hypothetical protein